MDGWVPQPYFRSDRLVFGSVYTLEVFGHHFFQIDTWFMTCAIKKNKII